MRSLKSIRLINFQSHKNTLITFAGQGYLTVITGPSDSGKSAVIRALRWVFYNVPQGDGFIFNAEDKCTVTLEYDDGTKVERIRSRGGINRYIVNGQTFEGFGTGVPLEVRQATGIRKLEIGDQSFLLNLSEQLDGPFLGKSVSGPARAKVLGKLAGTEEIDYASSEIKTDIYRAKRQKEDAEKDVKEKQKQLKQYDYIPSWERIAGKAETVLSDTKDKITQIEKLKALMKQHQDLSSTVLGLTYAFRRLQEVDDGLYSVQCAQEDRDKEHYLIRMLVDHAQAIGGREGATKQIKWLSQMIQAVSPVLNRVTEEHDNVTQHRDFSGLYGFELTIVNSLTKTVKRLAGIEKTDGHLRQAFNDNVKLSRLSGLHGQYEDSSLCALSLKRIILNFSDIERAENQLIRAKEDCAQLARLKWIQNDSVDLSGEIVHSNHLIISTQEAVDKIESEYFELMSNLGKCPMCGGDIDINKLREVI